MPKYDFIPANATIEELKAKAAELERQAREAKEPEGSLLREKAQVCLEWMRTLRFAGPWTSWSNGH